MQKRCLTSRPTPHLETFRRYQRVQSYAVLLVALALYLRNAPTTQADTCLDPDALHVTVFRYEFGTRVHTANVFPGPGFRSSRAMHVDEKGRSQSMIS